MRAVVVRVLPAADSDEQELVTWTRQLQAELRERTDATIAPLTADTVQPGAKGVTDVLGSLLAWFGTPEGLKSVLDAVRGWAERRGRNVEVSIDGDLLKVTGISADQQREIINAWLARHAA